MSSSKVRHAAMPIYRPPILRTEDELSNQLGKTGLNIYAKEFVMTKDSKSFRSNCDLNSVHDSKDNDFKPDVEFNKILPALSKSQTTDLLNLTKSDSLSISGENFTSAVSYFSNTSTRPSYELHRTKSSGSVLPENRNLINTKVQFRIPSENNENKIFGKSHPIKNEQFRIGNLKRSKSLTSTDASQFIALEATLSRNVTSFTEYELFPKKYRSVIKKTVEDANQMDDKTKVILGKTILKQALNNKQLAPQAAKLSIIIINQDKSRAYFDSLLNSCQMLYQTKNHGILNNPVKFTAFIVFILEMYNALKRMKCQAKLHYDSPSYSPKSIFLILLDKCCEDILMQNEIHSLHEIECLFLVLTSVGRDIENYAPQLFVGLFAIIREVLLNGRNNPEVQKVLLQLIELKAAKWQLPISTLNYYYPKNHVSMSVLKSRCV